LLFGFARDQFLLKRKGHFPLGFCPKGYSGSVAGRNAVLAGKNFPPQTPPIFARSPETEWAGQKMPLTTHETVVRGIEFLYDG